MKGICLESCEKREREGVYTERTQASPEKDKENRERQERYVFKGEQSLKEQAWKTFFGGLAQMLRNAQGLFLVLHLGMTPGSALRTIWNVMDKTVC